jgi:phospholipid/cholesterol/gamma-HCH transport system ATP-binding protein
MIVRTTELANAAGVVVSHVMSTIERCAERVILLYDGRFQWDGSISDFHSTENAYVRQFRSGSLRGPMQPAEP